MPQQQHEWKTQAMAISILTSDRPTMGLWSLQAVAPRAAMWIRHPHMINARVDVTNGVNDIYMFRGCYVFTTWIQWAMKTTCLRVIDTISPISGLFLTFHKHSQTKTDFTKIENDIPFDELCSIKKYK